MKKLLLSAVFVCFGHTIFAQQPVFFKELFATKVADTIFYPVHGTFRIDESGFATYKTLQLWVYDSKDKEVYYTVQSIPTREEYMDLVEKMVDKTYSLFMMKQGHLLAEKCEETEELFYRP